MAQEYLSIPNLPFHAAYRIKVFALMILFCFNSNSQAQKGAPVCGADRSELYLTGFKGLRLGLVVNHTSTVNGEHLVDFLKTEGITLKALFAPEHGLRGEADAGEKISNSVDAKTGIPIISIYGKNNRPTTEQLADIDLIIYDIQDVGCRFYTYISTLHYVMEACAENGKKLLVLDRPNPNGDYCAGPVLKPAFKSGVGVDPIPVVHGCTVGELAKMINGEGWLKNGLKCNLEVIPVKNYTHQSVYAPPIKPSPNLPNYTSIRLYPSLCFFESTSVSIGRGTTFPFQVIGFPDQKFGEFSFTPQSLKGYEMNPLQKDKICYGEDLRHLKEIPKFTLKYFLDWYGKFGQSGDFLTKVRWFNLLMGDDRILTMIQSGKSEKEISDSWQEELEKYKIVRSKYLLY
ncbi:MAG: DUF1343 domain-containing protein [Prolixibacteraceae bacterium]|nr:DUF1343 domain-containing protein [Prolixibacteraceae bacterium]